jgi:hypothetical protein
MNDTYWIHFYLQGAISQYLVGNGVLGGLQVILATYLIRDTLPSHHISIFALGSIITDLFARFLLRQSILSVTGIALAITGILCVASLFRMPISSKRSSSAPKVVVFGVGVAFLLHILIFGLYFLAQDHQPIITLMDHASIKFHDYAYSASAVTLREAVEEYNRRYGRPPPPGFDIWYQFATDRGTKVIHEYDQIVDDLRPFWGIEPKILRERVARVGGNAQNNFAQVVIRGNKAEIAVAPQWLVSSMCYVY